MNIKDLVDHIGSDSNFTHGIVRVTVGDLFKNIASNSNYMWSRPPTISSALIW